MKQVSLNNNNILLDANNIYIYNKSVDNDSKQTVLEVTTGSINVKVTGNFTKNVLVGGEFTASDRFLLGSSQGSNSYIFSDKHNLMMKHGATGNLYLYGNKINIGSILTAGSTGYINIGFTGSITGSVYLNGNVYLNGSILQPGGGAIYNAGYGISIDANNDISLNDDYFEFGTNVFNIKGNKGTLQLSSGGNSVKFCAVNGAATIVGSTTANYTVTPSNSLTLYGSNIAFTGLSGISGRSDKNITFAVSSNKITLNSGGSIVLSGNDVSLSGSDITLNGSRVYLSGSVYLNGSLLENGANLSPIGTLDIGRESKTTEIRIGNKEGSLQLIGSTISIKQGQLTYVFSGGSFVLPHS